MLTLDEIETAIRQLPEHSIRELTHRLSDYLEDHRSYALTETLLYDR